GDREALGAHDLELELSPDQPVERAAVGAREVLRGDEDRLEEPVDVALLREGDPDRVEVLELREEARLERAHEAGVARLRRFDAAARRSFRTDLVAPDGHGYLMQTALTCAMSVMPWRTFSMPSILSVSIPSASAVASMSATRACS